MAGSRRTWSELRTEIRYTLREPPDVPSFWDDTELLYLFNQERDRLGLKLGLTYENKMVTELTTDLVAGQSHYQVYTPTNRIIRLGYVYPDGRVEPMSRNEDMREPLPASGTGSPLTVPTYRVIGNFIALNPIPNESRSGALRIEVEEALDRVSSDSTQAIPTDWPIFCETYLVLATALAAFDVEGAQGPHPEGIYSSIQRRLEKYEVELEQYLETTALSPQYSQPFRLLD